MLRSLHWLPVAQRIDFKTALIVYKSLHGQGPKYMCDMLVPYEPYRNLRSSGRCLLEIPYVQSKSGEASFEFYAAKAWNNHPENLRRAPTLAVFKTRQKTVLFTCILAEYTQHIENQVIISCPGYIQAKHTHTHYSILCTYSAHA